MTPHGGSYHFVQPAGMREIQARKNNRAVLNCATYALAALVIGVLSLEILHYVIAVLPYR